MVDAACGLVSSCIFSHPVGRRDDMVAEKKMAPSIYHTS
jgi:hypothetical protein